MTDETPTLYALAQQALDATNNDVETAIDALYSDLSDDAELLRSLVRGAVLSSVKAHVRSAIGNQRQSVFVAATVDPARGKAGAEALARGIQASLLDMPLASGKRLRDAMRGEIAEAADRYAAISATTGHRARWLRLVAQSVPDGRRCGDVVTDVRALEMYHATEHENDEAGSVLAPIKMLPRRRAATGHSESDAQ